MKNRLGSTLFVVLLGVLTLSMMPAAQAQQKSQNGPAKYLYLSAISLKPGSMGQYIKIEQSRVADLRSAKAPGHFLTMEQITGSGMLISVMGFDSFADLQKMHDQIWSNKDLIAKLHANSASKGALIRESHSSIYMYRKDLSLHANRSLEDMRFMRIWIVQVKPGHEEDFENVAKAEAKAQGADADVHWAVFEKMYGRGSGTTYFVATPMKSLGQVDTMIANHHKMHEMVGEGLSHLVMSMEGKAIWKSEADLFAFSSHMSYVSNSWLEASPDFWGKK